MAAKLKFYYQIILNYIFQNHLIRTRFCGIKKLFSIHAERGKYWRILIPKRAILRKTGRIITHIPLCWDYWTNSELIFRKILIRILNESRAKQKNFSTSFQSPPPIRQRRIIKNSVLVFYQRQNCGKIPPAAPWREKRNRTKILSPRPRPFRLFIFFFTILKYFGNITL